MMGRLLVAAVWVGAMSVAAAQTTPKRPLKNGGFDESPAGKPPAAWKQAYPTGGGIVFNDGKETFLRIVQSGPKNAGVTQEVAIPPKVKTISVVGRMRGKPENLKEEKRAAVQIALRYFNEEGATINAAIVTSENSPYWHTFRREFAMPEGAMKVEVAVRSIFAIGTFDFNDVRVEFK